MRTESPTGRNRPNIHIPRFSYRGFTVVELVVVIALLGILATVALPRFLNITDDARRASIKGVEAAMASTSTMVAAKAMTQGVDTGNIVVGGQNISVSSGYITGHWNKAWRYAMNIGKEIGYTRTNRTCTANAFCGVGNQRTAPGLPITVSGRGLVLVWPEGMKLADRCYAYYYNPATGDNPTIGSVLTGC